jgi:Secretion system C-terminal sorting domain
MLISYMNFAQTSIGAIDIPNNTFEITNPASQLYFLSNSQIANKPNSAKVNSMVGVNFIKRFVGVNGATDPNSATNISYFQQVASNIRVFQNIEQDYITDGSANYSDPNFKIPATSSPGFCTTYPGTCVMNDWYLVHKNFKTVFPTQVHHTALECFNKPRAGDFPDKWFSLEQWGGSANSTSNQISTSSQRTKNNVLQTVSIRENAKEYAKEFARAYCPNSSNCNVNYLEIGNEPWGEPGWIGYQEVFKGVVDGLVEYYGSTNSNLWPMKISTPAFRAFQKQFSAVQPTQRSGLSAADRLLYGRDYIGYMIPNTNNSAGIPYKNYLSAINTHEYSVKNITYDNGVTYKEQDFELILEHPESPLTSFQKIKNMSLWKNVNVFPNLQELNVTEFGWNTENYPTTGNASGCYNNPVISLPASCATITTNISQQNQWLYKVQPETNSLLYTGSKLKSNGIGEIAQSAYLIRAYLLMARWNVNKGFIYESIDQPNVNPFHHTGIAKTVLSNPIDLASGNFSIGSPKLSYFALKKMNTLLANKYFLKAIKEDDKIMALVFGTKNVSTCTNNCVYTPTDLVSWAPQNINDGGSFVNLQTSNSISYANLSPNTIDINRYDKTDFIAKYVANSTPLANVDLNVAINNFSGITLGTSGSYLDWNTSDFTGGAVASENTNFAVNSSLSKNSSSQLVFTKLTAIPSVIPITVPSGCQVDANGVVSGCNISCTVTSPSVTASPSIVCGSSVSLTATCPTGTTVQWTGGTGTFPSGTTASTITVSPQINTIYSATCTSTCTSAPATSTVTVTGSCGSCNINFTTFNESATNITTTACPQNPITYDLNFTSSTAYTTSTDIIITGVPASQYLGYTATAGGTVTDIYPGGVRQLKWTLPTIATGTTYNAKFSFCYVNPAIHVTATTSRNTSATCDKLSGSGGCPTPATPTLTASPTTISSGQSSTLTASACTGGTNTFYNASTNAVVTSPVSPTTTTSYYAKCTVGTCVSANSNIVQVTVSSSCTVTANATNFITVTSGVKTFYVSKIQAPFQATGSAFDFANNDITMCKSLNSTARLATITNATENTSIKTAISNNGTSGNNYFIGYSNKTGSWTWNGGSSTFTPSGFTTTGSAANSAVQLVSYTPGWALNGINATSYFVCEVPCQNGSATRVGASESTGNDETESNLFTIYPNPTNDKLTVEYSLTKDSEINFGIMDMTGKTLQNRTIDGKAGTHSFAMDVSKIIEGSYILRGITEDKSQAKKFVIVR